MPVLTRDMVDGLVAAGASCRVNESLAPKFKQGYKVLVRNISKLSITDADERIAKEIIENLKI